MPREAPSPTARALLALDLVMTRPGITAEVLGERLGVSERAARRYVEILREADVPIESARGPYGGYRAGRGIRLPPLTFRADEALALVMAVLDGHHAADDDRQPVGRALGRILRALPEPVAAQAHELRRTAAAAPDRHAARPDPATTAELVRACAERRRVRMRYRAEHGRQWDRDVDPWAVVVRHGRWYLLCATHPEGERRAYRVDRVGRVELLDHAADVPKDLDPVAALEEHLAEGWDHQVVVRIDAPADKATHWLPRPWGRLEPYDDGSRCRLVGSTSNTAMYAEELARLPVAFAVERCEHLRGSVRELGTRLLAASDGGAP